MSLPALVVFSVRDPNDEVRYLSFTGPQRQLRCGPEENVFSDTARFAVEPAGNGLVHIRSRYENYYWARVSISEAWLTASAPEKVEDKSKDECTLFRPRIRAGNAFVRFIHVQSGMNVVMLPADDALGYNLILDYDAPTEFSFTDFRVLSLTKLPTIVIFLGDNDNYLSVDTNSSYLNFAEFNQPSNPRVWFEVLYSKTGDNLRIRSWSTKEFLCILPNKRVSVDSSPEFHPDTLFDAALSSPRDMTDKGIALRTLVHDQYCQRNYTGDQEFVAGTLSPDSLNVWLRPNYPFLPKRYGIVNIKSFRNAWTGPKSIRELTSSLRLSNSDIHEEERTVPVKYQARRITTFTHIVTIISKGYQALFQGRIPYAVETGELEFPNVAANVAASWGVDKVNEWTTTKSVKIVIPPRSSVRATVFVNIATYEVPFSYNQYHRSPVDDTTEHLHDGVLILRSEEFLDVSYDIQPLTSHQVLDQTIYTDLRALELEGINAVDDGIESNASHEGNSVQEDGIEPKASDEVNQD